MAHCQRPLATAALATTTQPTSGFATGLADDPTARRTAAAAKLPGDRHPAHPRRAPTDRMPDHLALVCAQDARGAQAAQEGGPGDDSRDGRGLHYRWLVGLEEGREGGGSRPGADAQSDRGREDQGGEAKEEGGGESSSTHAQYSTQKHLLTLSCSHHNSQAKRAKEAKQKAAKALAAKKAERAGRPSRGDVSYFTAKEDKHTGGGLFGKLGVVIDKPVVVRKTEVDETTIGHIDEELAKVYGEQGKRVVRNKTEASLEVQRMMREAQEAAAEASMIGRLSGRNGIFGGLWGKKK